jgi:hypothetical protein
MTRNKSTPRHIFVISKKKKQEDKKRESIRVDLDARRSVTPFRSTEAANAGFDISSWHVNWEPSPS